VLVATLALVAVALAGNADPQNFLATLAPATATYAGFGGCGFQYDIKSMVLGVGCNWILPEAGTAAHIHGPTATPGSGTADVIFTISSTGNSPAVSQTRALTVAEEADMFDGKWYINVHTTGLPNGAIRGTIIPAGADLVGAADGLQNGVTGSTYAGSIALTNGASAGAYTMTIIHNIPQAMITQCHIHGSATGGAGATNTSGVIFSIGSPASNSSCYSPILQRSIAFAADASGTVAQKAAWVTAGRTYLNIHTSAHPAGEIRAQINKLWVLTKPNRGSANALTVGLPVIASVLVALFALVRA